MKGNHKESRTQLGAELKRLREIRGLSQKKAANLMGCTRSTLCRAEVGRGRAMPAFLKMIAEFYGVPEDFLLGLSQEERIGQKGKLPSTLTQQQNERQITELRKSLWKGETYTAKIRELQGNRFTEAINKILRGEAEYITGKGKPSYEEQEVSNVGNGDSSGDSNGDSNGEVSIPKLKETGRLRTV